MVQNQNQRALQMTFRKRQWRESQTPEPAASGRHPSSGRVSASQQGNTQAAASSQEGRGEEEKATPGRLQSTRMRPQPGRGETGRLPGLLGAGGQTAQMPQVLGQLYKTKSGSMTRQGQGQATKGLWKEAAGLVTFVLDTSLVAACSRQAGEREADGH